MEPYTLILLACISGQPKCNTSYISPFSFTSYEACYHGADDEAVKRTSQLAQTGLFKGKEVVYDMTCVSRSQLRERYHIHQVDH